jgi:hypothetical protein
MEGTIAGMQGVSQPPRVLLGDCLAMDLREGREAKGRFRLQRPGGDLGDARRSFSAHDDDSDCGSGGGGETTGEKVEFLGFWAE